MLTTDETGTKSVPTLMAQLEAGLNRLMERSHGLSTIDHKMPSAGRGCSTDKEVMVQSIMVIPKKTNPQNENESPAIYS